MNLLIKTFQSVALSSLILFFVACDDKYDDNYYSRKLVINGGATDGAPVTVSLRKLQRVNDTIAKEYVFGATIKLFENNVFIEELKPFLSEWCQDCALYQSEHMGKALNTYRIEVNADGFEPAWASCTIPDTVKILSLDTINTINQFGDKQTNCTFTFMDTKNIKNYYYLFIRASMFTIVDNSNLFDTYQGSSPLPWFNDKTFDGKKWHLSFTGLHFY